MNEFLMRQAVGLHEAGRLQEAAELYQQILRANPRHFEALYSLGMVCLQAGQFEDAQSILGEALKLNPRFAEGWCARGIVLLQLRRREEALACFDRSLALRPDFLEALTSRATALLEMSRLDEALAGFDRVLALAPDHAMSWNNRGNALAAMKRLDDAILSYEKALAVQPDLQQAAENRDSALFELKRANRCPPAYMRNLFDGFAPHYDETMLEKLDYRAHLHLRTLANRVLPQRTSWRILDLGCGTGLVGEAFRDLAQGGRLDGMDIAPRMIEAAQSRLLYDDLILGDLEILLPAPGPSYGLILAADTMIYIGDLAPTFAGVARRLEPGGFYLFAVESKEDDGWEQTPMNRFRHSETYLRSEAARAGLTFVEIMECPLRHEAAAPVAGFAVALRKPELS